MIISSNFTVAADPGYVFDVLLDPQVMRQCILGCEELEKLDNTHYRGRLTSKVAHVKFNARFQAEIVELDRPRKIRVILNGEDSRLGSSLKVTVTLTIEPQNGESSLDYQMDIALWGKLGRLGESIVRRRGEEAERDFISALTLACTTQSDGSTESKSVIPSPVATPVTSSTTPAVGSLSEPVSTSESVRPSNERP